MKKKFATLIPMIVLFALSGSAQTNKAFVSKEGRFSIIAPLGFEKLNFKKDSISTDNGEVPINTFERSLDQGVCMISYLDVPEKIWQAKSVDKLLDDFVVGVISPDRAVTDQKKRTVDGYAAIELETRGKSGKFIFYGHVIVVIADRREYIFQFLSADKTNLNKLDVQNYFSSISILK